MDKCLNCDAPIEHLDGRRKKVFCGANCRVAFHRKKGKPDFVTIPKAEYEELKVLSARVVKTNEGVVGEFKVSVNEPKVASSQNSKRELKEQPVEKEMKAAKVDPSIIPDFKNSIEKMLWESKQQILKQTK